MDSSRPVCQPPAWYEALDAVLGIDSPPTMKLLLMALIVRAGLKPDGLAFPSLQTLARQIGIGKRDEQDKPREVRQVRRLLRSLKEGGLIEPNERPGMTTEYRIRWERLLNPGHQCPGSDSVSTNNPGHGCPPSPDADVLRGRTPVSALPGHPCPPNLPLNISQEPPPPNGNEWREVEGELETEGVGKARDAVVLARQRGYAPEQTMQIIQHYRDNAGAWMPGALYKRLTGVGSSMAIEQGWPKQDEKFVLKQQRDKEARQRAAEAARQASEDKQRMLDLQRDKDECQRLEDEFGAECDRLTADDLRQIATHDSLLSAAIQFHRKGKFAGQTAKQQPLIRGLLLKSLAQRIPSESPSEPATTGDGSQRTLNEGDARSPPTESNTPRKSERTPHANEMSALQSSFTSPSRSRNQ